MLLEHEVQAGSTGDVLEANRGSLPAQQDRAAGNEERRKPRNQDEARAEAHEWIIPLPNEAFDGRSGQKTRGCPVRPTFVNSLRKMAQRRRKLVRPRAGNNDDV